MSVLSFMVRVVIAAVLLAVVQHLLRKTIAQGLTSITIADVLDVVGRVIKTVATVTFKALKAPIKVLLSILKTVLDLPLRVAWETIPGIGAVGPKPSISSLIPIFDIV